MKAKYKKVNSSFLIITIILSLSNCSNSRFVLKQHNYLVENMLKGKRIYRAYKNTSFNDVTKDSVIEKCWIDNEIKRLNEIVPNSSFDNCKFEVTYEYIQKMNKFVLENNKKISKKLIQVSEKQINDTIYYFDSIAAVKVFGTLR